MQSQYDVVIIGGGAAGVFSAINMAKNNSSLRIAILEKNNRLLTKVKVSGGGRCNVTHACFEPKELVKFYPRGNKELIGPFHQFQPGDIIEWFATRNIELKIENDGRMFPTTDNSQTIIDCFLNELETYKIDILFHTEAKSIQKSTEQFLIHTNNKTISCNYLMVATGGFNKLKHYDTIKALGHTIQEPVPSLFTFNLPKNDILKLQGLVCQAEVKLANSSFSDQGPLLITHWGMSGPAILKLSSWAARFLFDENYDFNFTVNWMPPHNIESMVELITKQKEQHTTKKISNQFDITVPKKLKFFLIEKSGITADTKWAEVSKKQINTLAEIITKDTYHSIGKTTFKQEFVSCGGVTLNEVNFKTMESKIVPNLYFAGEVLNIDALTGGFNFQAAWTTGWIAAQSISS